MRLIDADKLYDWVRRECNPYGKPTIDFESGNRMLDMINRSQIAFDKEKVINDLLSASICSSPDEDSFIEMEEAIEIVEKGGTE